MPGYLVLNATGPRKYRGVPNSHFNPWSALFGAKDRIDIIWSDIGFFAALTGTRVESGGGLAWLCGRLGVEWPVSELSLSSPLVLLYGQQP